MKISQLINELDISLETLKSFEKELDYEFLFLDQIVSDKVVEKIKDIFKKGKQDTKYIKLSGPKISGDKIDLGKFINQDSTRTELNTTSSAKERRLNFLKKFYYNDTCYKIEAKVKWYYNHSNEGEYGFLTCSGIPDVHFNGSVVYGINPRHFRENDEVLVEIAIEELENRTKISALKVNKLEHEEDIIFLLYQSIEKGNHKYFIQTLEQIKLQAEQLSKKQQKEIQNIIEPFVNNELTNISQAIFLYELCELASLSIRETITNKVMKTFAIEHQFHLWLKTSATIPFNNIKDSIVNHITTTNSITCLDKLDKDEIEIVLNESLKKLRGNDDSKSNNLLTIIKAFTKYNIEIDYTVFNNNQLFSFWNNNVISYSPIDVIYSKVAELWYEGSKNAINQILGIFKNATEQELNDLFSKSHYDKDFVKNEKDFNLIRFFIDNASSKELNRHFFKTIYIKSPDYIKIKWFVLDYIDELDFYNTVIYTGILSPEMQKLYFKKVLMLIETKKLDLSLDDLNKITTIDYQTSEYAREIDGVGLDFTLCVILKLITDLSNNTITTRNTIFDIIANQVKYPDDLLVIDGFFEKCTGRTVLNVHEPDILDMEEKETTYSLTKSEYFPRFSNFCDGRKAMLKSTNQPSLCKKSGFEFWWCENNQCYNACRKQHSPEDWKNYTLEDVLRILKIDYNKTQYEILLNVVNRVNRFLEHLKCRSCDTILRPRKKSNYAFYGVTKFYCNNDLCEENNMDIYLSHCLNGNCEDIIDSRDTVKCKNEGHDDDCGWYICNNCYACCNSEKLEDRKNILERTGQEYKCHTKGHLNRGIICCPECGNETEEIEGSKELYEKQLNWFKEHKNIHPNITNYGQRNDGKYWFLWKQGNFTHEQYRNQLKSMLKSGFNIPNYSIEYQDLQLIGESFNEIGSGSEVFGCPKCDHIINFKDREHFDFHRLNSIKSFHKQLFPTFKNP
ncbi:hypothetical protein [Confluentibacter citreus]|uniref:hypothetical protein n=1 Tax=Confluentibacter citreus TaxID=2007307 RepID=UPI000C28BB55|nr:hypothetical protein [Confluentibacter citreus]